MLWYLMVLGLDLELFNVTEHLSLLWVLKNLCNTPILYEDCKHMKMTWWFSLELGPSENDPFLSVVCTRWADGCTDNTDISQSWDS